ncbi:hypothetical protein GCM10027440_38170 [Nocardiopsis coralliicola]
MIAVLLEPVHPRVRPLLAAQRVACDDVVLLRPGPQVVHAPLMQVLRELVRRYAVAVLGIAEGDARVIRIDFSVIVAVIVDEFSWKFRAD